MQFSVSIQVKKNFSPTIFSTSDFGDFLIMTFCLSKALMTFYIFLLYGNHLVKP